MEENKNEISKTLKELSAIKRDLFDKSNTLDELNEICNDGEDAWRKCILEQNYDANYETYQSYENPDLMRARIYYESYYEEREKLKQDTPEKNPFPLQRLNSIPH